MKALAYREILFYGETAEILFRILFHSPFGRSRLKHFLVPHIEVFVIFVLMGGILAVADLLRRVCFGWFGGFGGLGIFGDWKRLQSGLVEALTTARGSVPSVAVECFLPAQTGWSPRGLRSCRATCYALSTSLKGTQNARCRCPSPAAEDFNRSSIVRSVECLVEADGKITLAEQTYDSPFCGRLLHMHDFRTHVPRLVHWLMARARKTPTNASEMSGLASRQLSTRRDACEKGLITYLESLVFTNEARRGLQDHDIPATKCEYQQIQVSVALLAYLPFPMERIPEQRFPPSNIELEAANPA